MTTTNSPKSGNEAVESLQQGLEQLRVANYYLRVALDQSPEGTVIAGPTPDLAGAGPVIIFNNANAAMLSGVEPEKGLRDLPLFDLAATDADVAILKDTILRAESEGGLAECECALQRAYGPGPLNCRWRVRRVVNSNRELLNYTISFKEIQPGTEAEPTAEVAPVEDLDEQAERLRKENLAALAQGIVHDVNNLLGPVTARLTCILSELVDQPKLTEELGLVLAGLRRARQYTTQVVTACKARARTPQPTNLMNLIDETVEISGSGSNVRVRVNVEDGTDWVLAEPVKVGQVLQNLIMNGIQAMPTGGFMDVEARNRQITLGGDPILRPGKYVEIVVRDRGCGIAPENVGKVFRDNFTTKADGNGIGLTTCKRFIAEHHGDIRLKSTVNVGTEFTVILPAVGAPAGAGETKRASSAPVPLKHGKGSVLIVDDEDDLRHVARMILKRCGYEVTDCDNGQDAIDNYRRMWTEGAAPDVVLMDLTLRGGLNGCETAAEILRIDSQARLVVTSGSVNEEVQMIFLEQGFIGVLPKPYEAGELTQTVHHIVSLRQSSGE